MFLRKKQSQLYRFRKYHNKFLKVKSKEEEEVRVILNSIYAFKLFKIFIFALQKIQHTI